MKLFNLLLLMFFLWVGTVCAATVTITAPPNGAKVSGIVTISCKDSSSKSAWVNIGIDGNQIYSSRSPTGSVSWDTGLLYGSHVISCTGYHWKGGAVLDGTVSETVTIAPVVTIVAPSAGAELSGVVAISADTNYQVLWVNFCIDGLYLGSSPPYTIMWDSKTVPDGVHALSVKGYSTTGALLATAAENVTVRNATPSPSPSPTPTPIPSPAPSPVLTPAAPISYPLLPPGSALPSEAQCSTFIDTFEPRPANFTANQTMPSAAFLSTYLGNVGNEQDGLGVGLLKRVTGHYTGTTDAIIRWGACKWGFDEDTVRAIAQTETNWIQAGIGDQANGISLGLEQIKSRDYKSTCETVANSQNVADVNAVDCMSHLSTAFALDYKLAQQRACFEGYGPTYLSDPAYIARNPPLSGYPSWPNGTVSQRSWGCVGQWYSGGWYDAGALSYIKTVQNHLANKDWLKAGF